MPDGGGVAAAKEMDGDDNGRIDQEKALQVAFELIGQPAAAAAKDDHRRAGGVVGAAQKAGDEAEAIGPAAPGELRQAGAEERIEGVGDEDHAQGGGHNLRVKIAQGQHAQRDGDHGGDGQLEDDAQADRGPVADQDEYLGHGRHQGDERRGDLDPEQGDEQGHGDEGGSEANAALDKNGEKDDEGNKHLNVLSNLNK